MSGTATRLNTQIKMTSVIYDFQSIEIKTSNCEENKLAFHASLQFDAQFVPTASMMHFLRLYVACAQLLTCV